MWAPTQERDNGREPVLANGLCFDNPFHLATPRRVRRSWPCAELSPSSARCGLVRLLLRFNVEYDLGALYGNDWACVNPTLGL